MELKGKTDKLKSFFSKYKYALLVMVVGIVLMIIPDYRNSTQQNITPDMTQQEDRSETLDERLSEILSSISGAGKVKVLLSIREGEEKKYQVNYDNSYSDTGSSERAEVVIITDGSRNETALIQQINPQTYLGAVIICQGADSPTVRLCIIEAVSKITGLRSDQIAVLKMK